MVFFCLVTEANSLHFSRQVWNSSFGWTWCNHVCEEALPKQVKITYLLQASLFYYHINQSANFLGNYHLFLHSRIFILLQTSWIISLYVWFPIKLVNFSLCKVFSVLSILVCTCTTKYLHVRIIIFRELKGNMISC